MDAIVSAVQKDGYVELMLHPEEGDDYPYALYPDDPHGWAPELRVELARMVDDGEITVETAP